MKLTEEQKRQRKHALDCINVLLNSERHLVRMYVCDRTYDGGVEVSLEFSPRTPKTVGGDVFYIDEHVIQNLKGTTE